MTILTALLAVANLIFAWRELDVIRRSRTSIERREPVAGLPSLSILVPARNEERLFVILLGIGALDGINDPHKRDTAIFNGQYVMASREAYRAIGGHAAVRNEVAEDLELARLFKRDGRFRTLLAGSNALVRTRMYRSFGEIWRGFVKNFGLGARGYEPRAVTGNTLLACVSPLSPILLVALIASRAWLLALVLTLAMGAVVAVAESAMRAMRFRPGSGLAVPLGLALTLAIFSTSLVRMYGGRGVEWRGRRYSGGF